MKKIKQINLVFSIIAEKKNVKILSKLHKKKIRIGQEAKVTYTIHATEETKFADTVIDIAELFNHGDLITKPIIII